MTAEAALLAAGGGEACNHGQRATVSSSGRAAYTSGEHASCTARLSDGVASRTTPRCLAKSRHVHSLPLLWREGPRGLRAAAAAPINWPPSGSGNARKWKGNYSPKMRTLAGVWHVVLDARSELCGSVRRRKVEHCNPRTACLGFIHDFVPWVTTSTKLWIMDQRPSVSVACTPKGVGPTRHTALVLHWKMICACMVKSGLVPTASITVTVLFGSYSTDWRSAQNWTPSFFHRGKEANRVWMHTSKHNWLHTLVPAERFAHCPVALGLLLCDEFYEPSAQLQVDDLSLLAPFRGQLHNASSFGTSLGTSPSATTDSSSSNMFSGVRRSGWPRLQEPGMSALTPSIEPFPSKY